MTRKKKNPNTTNEIKCTAAKGVTVTKILDSESRAVNENTGLRVTETTPATTNENASQPVTEFPRPADGQPGSSPATNRKAELDVTETKSTTASDNAGKAANDQVGSEYPNDQ